MFAETTMCELTRDRALSLARNAGIPGDGITMLFGALAMTPQESARAMCALAATAGRLCAWDEISFVDAASLLKKVTSIMTSCSDESFRAWFNSRGESDFAIARDFINFRRQFGNRHTDVVNQVLTEFRTAVASKVGRAEFDVYADALADDLPLSTALLNPPPPLIRTFREDLPKIGAD